MSLRASESTKDLETERSRLVDVKNSPELITSDNDESSQWSRRVTAQSMSSPMKGFLRALHPTNCTIVLQRAIYGSTSPRGQKSDGKNLLFD